MAHSLQSSAMFQNVLKLAVKKSKFETSGVSGEYAEPPVKRPRLIGATKDPAIFNIDKDRKWTGFLSVIILITRYSEVSQNQTSSLKNAQKTFIQLVG